MSLRFIYGQASYDHDRAILNQIKNQMRADRGSSANNYYFYLVPNHIKFKSEVNTLKDLNPEAADDYAQINVQILSFTRLAWFFMSRIPWKQPQQLSDSGISMLLYKIISQENGLEVFQTEANQPGFITKLASQINEMKTGQISPDDLANDLSASGQDNGKAEWNPDLTRKMHDFVKIYRDFEDQTRNHYLGKADVLSNLSHFIKAGRIHLDHYHFYLSGFSQFTAQESELVKQLILHSASVVVDLDLDPACRRNPSEPLPHKPNLFYKPALLYRSLLTFAKENGIRVITDKAANQQRDSDDLLHLDNFWKTICQSHNRIKPEKLQNAKSIQVVKAPNRYSELSKVALMIRQMVATGHYRYSDFIIMTRHLDKFKNIIRPIFKAQSIPIFVDLQKSMDTHPLVQLLESLFSIYNLDPDRTDAEQKENDDYQYADVMNLLKTELLIPKTDDGKYMDLKTFRDDLAITENWVLKTGYRGSEWTKKADWKVIDYNDVSDFGKKPTVNKDLTHKVNVIHQFIRKTLPPFYHHIANAKTGLQAATILYHFLTDSGVLDQLKKWQKNDANPQDQKNNDITAANEIGQVWKVFCQLLDDFVEILGKRAFNLNHFLSLLKAGFEGSVYSQIPSTLDQVVISESRIVQTNDYKVVFMIGSTDEVMPDKITNDALFSDEDRTEISPYLKQGVQYLNDDSTSQMDNEPFLNYLAFMSATQRIIFTYSLNNEDDKDKKVQISPYVKQIAEHFNLQPIQVPLASTATAQDKNSHQANRVIDFVGSREATLRHLVQAACDSNNYYEDKSKAPLKMNDAWYYLYSQLVTDPATDELTNKLLGGLDYNNQPAPSHNGYALKPTITTQLYGKDLNTSISQLEQFYQDPYEYFLKYGLRLKPRDVFGLTSINIGRFYHKLMEDFVKNINLRQIDLKQLTAGQIRNMIRRITAKLLTDSRQPQYQVLNSSNRMGYIKHHLMATVERMIMTMHQQSDFTAMRPFRAEIPFGVHKALEVPRFKAGPHHINIRGRIDRIDAMKLDQEGFFSVVDYKSSQHRLDYGPIYYGDELQMMTYLDILNYNLKRHNVRLPRSIANSTVAGVLYAWIHTPKLSPRDAAKDVKTGILKSQKYHDALLVDDPTLLKHLDSKLRPSSNSIIYPIRRNKNGYSMKNLIKPDDLKLILQWTQHLIIQAGKKIYQGDIKIDPMQFNNRSNLKYSPYQPIMQFDPLISSDRYHEIPKLSLGQVITKLKNKLNANQK